MKAQRSSGIYFRGGSKNQKKKKKKKNKKKRWRRCIGLASETRYNTNFTVRLDLWRFESLVRVKNSRTHRGVGGEASKSFISNTVVDYGPSRDHTSPFSPRGLFAPLKIHVEALTGAV